MVDAIVDELWERKQLGDAQIAAAAHIRWTAGRQRKRALNRIYFLMPDIVCEIARRHPGYAAVRRDRAGLVEVTNDPDRAIKVSIPRYHQVMTKLDRLSAEAGPALVGTTEQQAWARWIDGFKTYGELGPILLTAIRVAESQDT